MQTHALALARGLHELGYELEVLTYRANRHEEKNAVREIDAKLPFKVHRVLSRLGYWRNIDFIAKYAGIYQPDLIYSSTVFYGFLKDKQKAPVICRSVGNDVMRPWLAYPFPFGSWVLSLSFLDQNVYDLFKRFNYPEWVEIFFHRQRRRLMMESARRMDCIMANSAFTRDLLLEIGMPRGKILEVVGGVDAARFQYRSGGNIKKKNRLALGLPTDCYLISTACRLVAKKGVDFLLNSLKEIREKMPDVHMAIIGDGKHEKKYRRMARELGLEEHVSFVGRVPQEAIQKYFWASDAFVLASRIQVNQVTGLRDAETMGRVLCEANAAGIPVIAARSGGIPSVIKNRRNGLLFKPDDVASLIKALKELRGNRELRNRMIKEGLSRAKNKFDWKQIISIHEACIRGILKLDDIKHSGRGKSREKKKKAGKRKKRELVRS